MSRKMAAIFLGVIAVWVLGIVVMSNRTTIDERVVEAVEDEVGETVRDEVDAAVDTAIHDRIGSTVSEAVDELDSLNAIREDSILAAIGAGQPAPTESLGDLLADILAHMRQIETVQRRNYDLLRLHFCQQPMNVNQLVCQQSP